MFGILFIFKMKEIKILGFFLRVSHFNLNIIFNIIFLNIIFNEII
jgi:hypothetical protein